jgi:nucleoside-diphosphate-sugar epimerase
MNSSLDQIDKRSWFPLLSLIPTIALTRGRSASTVSDKLIAVTGATGLLGSHLIERLVARGQRVRALVRPRSKTAWLRERGVELVVGDLGVPDSLRPFVAGASTVYHCAARVGDWGPWRLFRQSVLEATCNVLAACKAAGVGRFLHVSSISVYGHPRLREGEWLSEDSPLGVDLWWADHYCRAKILAEQEVRGYPGQWTIVRPSWMYGPRDHNSFPRVVRTLRRGAGFIVGPGDNRLNIVHAADVAGGMLRAAEFPGAVGQAYNLASEGDVTQSEFLNALTDALNLKRVRRHIPFRLAFTGAFLAELVGRIVRRRRPPILTRYAVSLIGRSTRFRIDKARGQLGWQPTIHPLEGLKETLAWYLAWQEGTLAWEKLGGRRR